MSGPKSLVRCGPAASDVHSRRNSRWRAADGWLLLSGCPVLVLLSGRMHEGSAGTRGGGAMPDDGSCLRSPGPRSRPGPPASLAQRATASPGPSSPACSSSRPRSSPLAWSMIALRSCRGLRRSASGWAGPQAEGCYAEIRRGAGPVQVHAAGMTASRGRGVMERLGAGLGGEGLAAGWPGAVPGPRHRRRVSPMGARKGRDDCDSEHR